MYRFLTPILALIVTVTLFFTFIQPTFIKYREIDIKINDYDAAFTSADKLLQSVSDLQAEKDAISQSDISRLMTFLPDSVDEVAVVLTLDDLATKYNLVLEDIKIKSLRSKDGAQAQAPTTVFQDDTKETNKEIIGADGTKVKRSQDNVETISLSFTVTGEYTNFRKFTADMEKSLALMDISSLSITESKEGEFSSYVMGVTMYRFMGIKK